MEDLTKLSSCVTVIVLWANTKAADKKKARRRQLRISIF